MLTKINLAQKAEKLSEAWTPGIIGELNNQEIKIALFEGEFTWHAHPDTDELFLVLDGSFELQLRDESIQLNSGEMIVVPKGVEHRPVVSKGVAKVLLIENIGTENTGNNPGKLSVKKPSKI